MKEENTRSLYEISNLTSYEGDEPFIFVSYSHHDTEAVSKVLRKIDSEKYRYWYDDTMEIGEDFRKELREKIEKCSAFLLFISEASMNSKYCGMEIIAAYKNDKRIFPVYLQDDVEIPAPLKMVLENLQHVKGLRLEKDNFDRYIKKLVASLPVETMRSLDIEDGVLRKCKDGSPAIAIPHGVSSVGPDAFKNCEKLEAIDFGFEVTHLQKEAFRGCKNIKFITLPQGIRFVGESAFRDCISMTTLTVENDDIEIGERAFENCASLSTIHLKSGMTEIYGGVFNSCKSLEHIELPEKLTILGESSFADCIRLKKITIPPLVTKIDDMVFNGCIELSEVLISESVSKIGKNAFKDCKSLKTIYLPAAVSNIGAGPFRGCSSLQSITVSPKSKHFKSVDNVLFNKNKSILLCFPAQAGISSYEIPDSVTVISDWAFCECAQLQQVSIPDSVYEIGEGAFYLCSSLEKIVIPDSVVKIDDTAFRGCTALRTVYLPDSLTDFGWGLFNGCDQVRVICSNGSAAASYCDAKSIPHSDHE